MSRKLRVKVIIIGGGLGGLSAAIRLAKRNHEVHLYEAATALGGKCQVESFDGFSFDTGPSLLTLPAVYRDLFLKSGAPLESALSLTSVDPAFDYYFTSGKRLTLPNLSRTGVVAAIEKSFGHKSAREWEALMTRAEAMWDISREPFVESELLGISTLLKRPRLLRNLKTIAPFTSLRKIGKRYLAAPELRTLIDRYATYSGSDPRRAPAVLLTIPYIEQTFGAWHITGGVGRLSTALATRAEEVGVKIYLNSPVQKILTQDTSAVGIRLESGEEIMSDLIISNVDAEITYKKLLTPISIAAKERKKIARAIPSFSGFYLLLGLQGRSNDLNHHTISFPENYDAEFDSLFKSQTPVVDPTIYICSPNDKSMLPQEDAEAWFVLVNAPRHSGLDSNQLGFDWSRSGVKEEYGEKIIELLVTRGFLNRSRIISRTFRSPLDIEKMYNAPGGSIYGKSSNGVRAAFNRAANRSPITGLFCVGGSAHPGGGVPLVGLSGEIVARMIAEEESGQKI